MSILKKKKKHLKNHQIWRWSQLIRDKFFSCIAQCIVWGFTRFYKSCVCVCVCEVRKECVILKNNDDNNNSAYNIKKNHKSTLKSTTKKYVDIFFLCVFILIFRVEWQLGEIKFLSFYFNFFVKFVFSRI